jgi:hypothetical protein
LELEVDYSGVFVGPVELRYGPMEESGDLPYDFLKREAKMELSVALMIGFPKSLSEYYRDRVVESVVANGLGYKAGFEVEDTVLFVSAPPLPEDLSNTSEIVPYSVTIKRAHEAVGQTIHQKTCALPPCVDFEEDGALAEGFYRASTGPGSGMSQICGSVDPTPYRQACIRDVAVTGEMGAGLGPVFAYTKKCEIDLGLKGSPARRLCNQMPAGARGFSLPGGMFFGSRCEVGECVFGKVETDSVPRDGQQ